MYFAALGDSSLDFSLEHVMTKQQTKEGDYGIWSIVNTFSAPPDGTPYPDAGERASTLIKRSKKRKARALLPPTLQQPSKSEELSRLLEDGAEPAKKNSIPSVTTTVPVDKSSVR